MHTPLESAEVTQAFSLATTLAARAGVPCGSVHLLLALFAFPNRAAALLAARGVAHADVRAALPPGPADEPASVLAELRERASAVARNGGAEAVDCLHLLVALSRLREARALQVLHRSGHDLVQLRNAAVATMTGTAPRRFVRVGGDAQASGGARHGAAAGRTTSGLQAAPPTAPMVAAPAATIVPGVLTTTAAAEAAAPTKVAAAGPAPVPASSAALADGPPAANVAQAADARPMTGALTPVDVPVEADAPVARTAPAAAPAPSPAAAAPAPAPSRPSLPFDLSTAPLADIAPVLAECATDLTLRARQGQLDRAIGRDRELEALADVLGKRRANNPVLVGPPGVGKTAIVEGLAIAWSEIDPADNLPYDGRRIVALDTGAMVAGTSLRGSLSERLSAIKTEVADADGHLVVFIDELHTLMGAGASGEGPQDAAGELKTALARGEFPCIGATTDDEFKRYIERDPALERRFSPIAVAEPSVEDAQAILRGALGPYQAHHRVRFADDAVEAAVVLTHRFVTERKLPDKAFAALDLAGSRAHRRGKREVRWAEVAAVVHEWTDVPLERLIESDAQRFARAETYLGGRLVGHPHVVDAVAQALRRGFAGFNGRRPMGSFLFLGPTGVGKTEMVKILAEFVFGKRDAIVRFDMSELAEKHSVARLLGAQPGYVGYDEGGQLTEALRKRPFQIVLFDEVEKAHPDVLNVLLQLLDEGHLTDAQGRRISFANTLVVLTSNLGAQALDKGSSIGFGAEADSRGARTQHDARDLARMHQVQEAARAALTPELWARIDEHLVFLPLTYPQVERIAQAQLEAQRQALVAARGVRLSWGAQVVPFLLRQGGFSTTTGARGLRQAIQRHVEAPIAATLLEGTLQPYGGVHLEVRKGEAQLRLRVTPTSRPPPRGDGRSPAPSRPPPGSLSACPTP